MIRRSGDGGVEAEHGGGGGGGGAFGGFGLEVKTLFRRTSTKLSGGNSSSSSSPAARRNNVAKTEAGVEAKGIVQSNGSYSGDRGGGGGGVGGGSSGFFNSGVKPNTGPTLRRQPLPPTPHHHQHQHHHLPHHREESSRSGLPSSVSSPNLPASAACLWTAIFDYEARREDELTLRRGCQIRVISTDAKISG